MEYKKTTGAGVRVVDGRDGLFRRTLVPPRPPEQAESRRAVAEAPDARVRTHHSLNLEPAIANKESGLRPAAAISPVPLAEMISATSRQIDISAKPKMIQIHERWRAHRPAYLFIIQAPTVGRLAQSVVYASDIAPRFIDHCRGACNAAVSMPNAPRPHRALTRSSVAIRSLRRVRTSAGRSSKRSPWWTVLAWRSSSITPALM